MIPDNLHETGDCRAISEMLSRIGDKWSVLVVTYLGEGSLRFSELRRQIGSISQKMLTVTLRNLERDGFLTRTIFPTSPPAVEYELTDLGRELLVPVQGMADWARANMHRINESRERFDSMLEKRSA